MRMIGHLRSSIRSLIGPAGYAARRSIAGTSAVEFALASTVIMAIVAPVVDLGMALYQRMQVQAAAQAGAEYGVVHGWDASAISNAVTSATALPVSASPPPSLSCGCPTGTAITAAACGTTCSNGQLAGSYLTVSAQATYIPIAPYSVLGGSVTLQASSTVRIQ